MLAVPTTVGQLGAIALGALAGIVLLRSDRPPAPVTHGAGIHHGFAIACLAVFFALLIGLPLLSAAFPNQALALFNAFYRAGSLVFGGGHVVLPLLQAAVVPPGWVSNDAFLAGYGAAQAVPGPLFTFAAYLGAVMGPAPNGWLGAAIALVAIFLPSFLLVIGVLPFWQVLRGRPFAQSALAGVNAAVVGLLLAALYNPVWTAAHPEAARLRGGARGVPPAHGVEDAALARRACLRGRRRAHRVAQNSPAPNPNARHRRACPGEPRYQGTAVPPHDRGGRDKPGHDGSGEFRYRQRSIAWRCRESGGSSSNSMRTPLGSMMLLRTALVALFTVSPTAAPRSLNIATAAGMLSTTTPK